MSSPFDGEVDALPKFFDSTGDGGAAAVQARWEHTNIRNLLKHYSLEKQAREMTALLRQKTNSSNLTFEVFKMFNPTFPIWLSFRKKRGLHQGGLVEAFQRPSGPKKQSKSWMYQLFEEAEGDAPPEYQESESNFGVVFEFMYADIGSYLIAYRYNGALKPVQTRTARLIWDIPHSSEQIVVSALDVFLECLPWTPPE